MTINLGTLLALKPLDRIQLNDPREVRDMQFSVQLGYGQTDLPFLYFQYVRDDGHLMLCSPSGYITSAAPSDVCDVIPGHEIKVRAMPRAVFMQRLRLHYSEFARAPGPECYAQASVLRVSKDRWGRVDQVFVRFDDPDLNEDYQFATPIHPDDRALVEASARRTHMPVIAKSAGARSADHGTTAKQQAAGYAVRTFFSASLRGHGAKAAAIRQMGIKELTTAQINRLQNIAELTNV